jgi:hypothetical protein
MSGVSGRRVASVALALLGCAIVFLTAVALAAKPKKNARFTGHTDARAVLGFRAPVRFKVSADARQAAHFTFGTFGCFGAGGFRPGVNPYTGHSLIDVGTLKITGNGRLSGTGTSSYTVSGQTTTFTVSVSASFAAPKTASGTITYSEKVTSSSFNTSCGPAKLQFSASAH